MINNEAFLEDIERLPGLQERYNELFDLIFPKIDSKSPKLFDENDPLVIEWKLVHEEITLIQNQINFLEQQTASYVAINELIQKTVNNGND